MSNEIDGWLEAAYEDRYEIAHEDEWEPGVETFDDEFEERIEDEAADWLAAAAECGLNLGDEIEPEHATSDAPLEPWFTFDATECTGGCESAVGPGVYEEFSGKTRTAWTTCYVGPNGPVCKMCDPDGPPTVEFDPSDGEQRLTWTQADTDPGPDVRTAG